MSAEVRLPNDASQAPSFRYRQHARQVWFRCFKKSLQNADRDTIFPWSTLKAFLKIFYGKILRLDGQSKIKL